MKLLLLTIAMIAILLGGYYYLQPDQAKRVLRDAGIVTAPEVTRIYKWQDKAGNWHVSNTPPPDNIQHEVQEYRNNDNVLPLPPQLQDND